MLVIGRSVHAGGLPDPGRAVHRRVLGVRGVAWALSFRSIYQSLAVNHIVPHCPPMPVIVILGGIILRFVIVSGRAAQPLD